MTTRTSLDILRQALVVIFAVTVPLASNIASIVGYGRSISDQSDASDTLLVPWSFAFSIWGPIFLGLFAYAIIQGFPKNGARPIYRATGWLMVASLGLITAWGLAAAFPPEDASRWLTALIFVPAMAAAVQAMVILSRRKAELSALEGWAVWAPISLLAGWCSLAVFLNWSQLGVNGPIGFGLSETVVCLLALASALAWVVWSLHKTAGNAVYAFPVLWGLGFLAYARLAVDDLNMTIAVAAIVGFLIVLGSTLVAARRKPLPLT